MRILVESFVLPLLFPFFAVLVAINDSTDDSEGRRHFMVNVIEPQFNLHSEDANVSLNKVCI